MMQMEYTSQKSVRFYPESDQTNFRPPYDNESSRGSRFSSFNIASPFIKPGGLDNLSGSSSNGGSGGSGKSDSFVVGKGSWRKKIFDPGSEHIQSWNRIFLISCLVALFLDPLYFYFPYEGQSSEGQATCLGTDKKLGIAVTIFRTFADVFYFIHMLFKFRTAYIAPSSRVFGRGVLVMDPKKIAIRYLKSDFAIDFIASLPLPQVVIWVIPAVRNSSTAHKNVALALIVLFQYIPRLYLIFPLSAEMVRATGVVTKTAWAGAAYNLLLYMIASHVLGAAWYLISIERHTTCWRGECSNDKTCTRYLDCSTLMDADRIAWANSTQVFGNCDPNNSTITFKYGIFLNALTNNIGSSNFINKYLYCLWWGLQQLSSYGQNLQASTFIGETAFCILIAIMGLVLFAHLIGNMQTYLQSLTVRLEEWRLKKRDTEEWMKHRQLPPELQERVRRFVQYKWVATRGVNEGSILSGLPTDLHREIRRHLSLDLVRRVHFFSQMDDQLLDAICERLVSSLSTEGTYIVREGDPVTEMLFIIRGRLDSCTTNGGRTGFFDSTTLKPGDFCGEELLEWALLPKKAQNLPSSTRTVRALTEVEGFALPAEGLKFVANQFRRLHSKKLQHTLHFYSHHWRTWAARFIQAAWRRFKQRKMAMELSMRESFSLDEHNDGYDSYVAMQQSGMPSDNSSSSKQNLALLASRFAGSTKKGTKKGKVGDLPTEDMPMPKKPNEPDYSNEGEEEQP